MKAIPVFLLFLFIAVSSARKYVQVRANSDTFYGDLNRIRTLEYGVEVPMLAELTDDIIFDLQLFDKITFERTGTFEVQNGESVKTVTGNKINLFMLDTADRLFQPSMAFVFTNDGNFRIIERILLQLFQG